jgi:hypothetical protein
MNSKLQKDLPKNVGMCVCVSSWRFTFAKTLCVFVSWQCRTNLVFVYPLDLFFEWDF